MSTIVLRNVGDKVDILDIERFEKQFARKLPTEYKDFLIKNNGGYPTELLFTPDFFEVNPMTLEKHRQGTDVERFLSLNEISFEYEDILDENYIPPYYVPFARTSFGNLLLLCVDVEKDYGSVHFSNHDLFDTNNNRFAISKIADSFAEFMELLYIPDLKQA